MRKLQRKRGFNPTTVQLKDIKKTLSIVRPHGYNPTTVQLKAVTRERIEYGTNVTIPPRYN